MNNLLDYNKDDVIRSAKIINLKQITTTIKSLM